MGFWEFSFRKMGFRRNGFLEIKLVENGLGEIRHFGLQLIPVAPSILKVGHVNKTFLTYLDEFYKVASSRSIKLELPV